MWFKQVRRYQVGFEVLTAVSTKKAVFWVVAPCSLVEGKLLPDYAALQPRRQRSSLGILLGYWNLDDYGGLNVWSAQFWWGNLLESSNVWENQEGYERIIWRLMLGKWIVRVLSISGVEVSDSSTRKIVIRKLIKTACFNGRILVQNGCAILIA
jgi:hypothetical protein